MRNSLAAILIALLTTANQGQAQTPPATPTASQGLGGPSVAGVCFLSREAIYANAKVGQAATARLRELAQQAQTEINADRAPIQKDITAFNAESAKLSIDQRTARQQALAARLQPTEIKAAQRQREIEATRAKALERVSQEVEPVLAPVYRQRGCGVLLDRGTVIGGNMANDLTEAVVKALDAKIQTITFQREVLPMGAGAPR